ncbi:hypothetical protein IFM89_012684 [Coptis chinensis]|uniref:Transposase MuDR plant domain-containing protein n=1 Tax=Coptis chinensis TaxID=261450 RepID=A0A835H2J5_9MAGN|nr:hypothetical protein IFM89_012684 [Coptis chinensis]
MTSPLLGVKEFVVHYGGCWGITTPGKLKRTDYKGGKKSEMQIDGDELCMLDVNKDVRKLVGGVDSFEIACLIEGFMLDEVLNGDSDNDSDNDYNYGEKFGPTVGGRNEADNALNHESHDEDEDEEETKNIYEAEEMEKVSDPPVINEICDLRPKMSWPTLEDCRDFFKFKAIKRKFSFRQHRNDKVRYILLCKDEDCKWTIAATITRDGHTFILRKFNDEHTCEANEKNKYCQATSPWVAKHFQVKVRDHPNYKPKDLEAHMFSKFGVKILYWTAWSAKIVILEKLNGNYEEEFALVPEL